MVLQRRLRKCERADASDVSVLELGIVLVLVFSFMFGVTGIGMAAEPIRIGLQAPITGSWALEGEMAVNSVQVVADQINARGGVLGRPVEIVIGDDQGEPRQ